MSKRKDLSDNKIKELFLSDNLTEEKMIEMFEQRYTDDSAKIMIDSLLSIKADMKEKIDRQEKEAETKHITVRCLEIGKNICESITYMGQPMFIMCSPDKTEEEMWNVFPVVKGENIVYHPVDMTPYSPYSFTKEELNRFKTEGFNPPHLAVLFDKIYSTFQIFIKAPPEILTLLTVFVLETYQQNKIDSMSYLFATGLPDSGKTRIAELLTFLCYRALFAANLNAANVYDFIGEHGEGTCTIIDDEAQDFAKDKDKLKIYRQGYRRGAKIRRIIDAGSASRTARYYDSFCSKFFAGYYVPYDRPFRERNIPFNMLEGEPEKDEIGREDIEYFNLLKKKLLLSRMRYYSTPLPKIDLPYKGRMKELWKSKIQVVEGLPAEQVMREFAEKYKANIDTEKKISLEAFIVRTIMALHKSKKEKIPFHDIWYSLCWSLGEPEHIKTTKFYSETLNREISKKVIGSILKSSFGGKPEFTSTRVYTFQEDLLSALQRKYMIVDKDIEDLSGTLKLASADPEEAKEGVKVTIKELFL